MMHIYIAGPMSGYKDLNRPAFTEAGVYLLRQGYIPILPYMVPPFEHEGPCPQTYDAGQPDHDAACYLRNDLLLMLAEAAAAVFLPDWDGSRGADLEHRVAHGAGIPIYYFHGTAAHSAGGRKLPLWEPGVRL